MKKLLFLISLAAAVCIRANEAPKPATPPPAAAPAAPATEKTILLLDGKEYTAAQIQQAFTEIQQALITMTNKRNTATAQVSELIQQLQDLSQRLASAPTPAKK